MIDLTTLPEPVFLTVNWDEQYKALREAYEQIAGRPLSKGQVEALLLATFAYRENLLRINVNDVAKQNLLAYARAEVLDHLGASLGVTRLQPAFARTTIRFTFVDALIVSLLIPAGTRVISKDHATTFLCVSAVALPGETSVEVSAVCADSGEQGNGYLVGDINILVDPLPFVEQAENVSVSFGGSDTEDDDRFRFRIQSAPESFSTAGPSGAYKYWAQTTHQDIVDVAVWSPEAGTVKVAPLLKDGMLPDQEMIARVESVLNHEKVRPLTDEVVVVQPRIVPFEVSIQLYLYRSLAMLYDTILTQANKALQGHVDLLKRKLGMNIVPEQIVGLLQKISGVCRAVVLEPQYTELARDEAAVCGNISIVVAGTIND